MPTSTASSRPARTTTPGPPARTLSCGDPAELAPVTAREREVLTLVARGLSNAEVSGRLGISPTTVKTHIGHLLAKLGVRTRAQLVMIAYESGVVVRGAG